jgi:hypothetical protein
VPRLPPVNLLPGGVMTKFIAQAGDLATAAKVAAGVVNANAGKRIKVLGAALIDAGNPIRIVGTDLDQAAIAEVAGHHRRGGPRRGVG